MRNVRDTYPIHLRYINPKSQMFCDTLEVCIEEENGVTRILSFFLLVLSFKPGYQAVLKDYGV